MSSSLFPAPGNEVRWSSGSRALLNSFLTGAANTRLKVRILALFLSDGGLCLSSQSLAKRLNVPVLETRNAVRQLCEDGALHYCPQFAFADLCSLSLPFLSSATRLQLGLLRFALCHEPGWVWKHFETSDSSLPMRSSVEPGARELVLSDAPGF